jgi:integrase-like protein
MTDEAVSRLRWRMIEDMTIRKFAPKTQHDYVQRIKNFAAFLGRSPDTASFEDVRRISCIWRRAASECRPSIRPSRRCGSFSRSR